MILSETLQWLETCGAVEGRFLRSVYLNPYFTVVELDDGSVGAGMSYYTAAALEGDALQGQVRAMLTSDPLLLEWLFRDREPWGRVRCEREQARLLVHALRTAVLSALSAPLLRAGGDATFTAGRSLPFDPFAGARSALVIGFGGYMEPLARAAHIVELHVHDLGYATRSREMDEVADCFRRDCPGKRLILSDGRDTGERLRAVDVVAITGSALCNGTLERLLEQAHGGPRIVVQGQSASIHPAALCRRGVSLVTTTLKPLELARLAAADPTGEALKPLLEGGLPQVYCVPRRPG